MSFQVQVKHIQMVLTVLKSVRNKSKSWCLFLRLLSYIFMLGQKAFFALSVWKHCIFSVLFVTISITTICPQVVVRESLQV